MLGEEHGNALVVAGPAGIAISTIGQVGGEQRVELIVGKLSYQRFEADSLQHDIAVGVAEHFLVDAVAATDAAVSQVIGRDSGLERHVFKGAMAFFLGEEFAPISNQESHIAGAGLIDAREIDFVENAVAQCEPNLTVLVEGSSRGSLGARGPARGDAWSAGGVSRGQVGHEIVGLGGY
jgi:hypothetical protein